MSASMDGSSEGSTKSVFAISKEDHCATDGSHDIIKGVALTFEQSLEKARKYDHDGWKYDRDDGKCECYDIVDEDEDEEENGSQCFNYPMIIREMDVLTDRVLKEVTLMNRDQLNEELQKILVPPKSANKK